MSKIYSHIVWLGAGDIQQYATLLEQTKRATLIDGREDICKILRQEYSREGIEVIQALISNDGKIYNFTEYNLAEYSAISPPENIKSLYPGLLAIKSSAMESLPVDKLVNDLQLENENNLLILDIPDISLALFTSLADKNLINKFRDIFVLIGTEPLYLNSATKIELDDSFQKHGYQLVTQLNADPDVVKLKYSINPLWDEFKKISALNQSLINSVEAQNSTSQKVIEQRKFIDKQKSELLEIQSKYDALANKLADYVNERGNLEESLSELRRNAQKDTETITQLRGQLTTAEIALADINIKLSNEQKNNELLKTSTSELIEKVQLIESHSQKILEQRRYIEKQKTEITELTKKLTDSLEQNSINAELLEKQLKCSEDANKKNEFLAQELSRLKTELSAAELNLDTKTTIEMVLKDTLSAQSAEIAKQIGEFKNSLGAALSNSTKQIESFIGVNDYVNKGIKPLSFHGWPISPDIGLNIIGLIDANNYDAILEFGSGTSTVLMAKALIAKYQNPDSKFISEKSDVKNLSLRDDSYRDLPNRLITFEHNSIYFNKTLQSLKNNSLEYIVDLVHAPLVDYQYKGDNYLYYNCNEKLQELARIYKGRKAKFLVLVDGPPGATNKNARFPALPHLLNNLPEHTFTIIMDDYNRPEEKEITKMWTQILDSRYIQYTQEEIKCEKGCTILSIE